MRRLLLAFAALACSSAQPPTPATPCKPTPPAAQSKPAPTAPRINAEYPSNSPPLPGGLPLTGHMITCDFRVFANGRADDGNPTIDLSAGTPVTMTFAGLSSSAPMLKGNGGESPIIVLNETRDDEVVAVERNGEGNIFTYTISRETGLAIWTKAYFMFNADQPTGTLSVGRCY